MTVCWLVVNTLLGVGMQVVAEAVALGSIPNLPFCGTPTALTDFVFFVLHRGRLGDGA
jgi:hypothetical protein